MTRERPPGCPTAADVWEKVSEEIIDAAAATVGEETGGCSAIQYRAIEKYVREPSPGRRSVREAFIDFCRAYDIDVEGLMP